MKKDIQRGVAKGGRSFKKARKTFQRAVKPGQDKSAATVVFVPSTNGSLLLKTLKEDEERMAALTGFKIKYQEAGGSVLCNAFCKDLGKGQHCMRKDCPPCNGSDKRENCRSKNLVYKSKCKICNPRSSRQEEDHHGVQPSGSKNSTPRQGIYIGETSRSLHERAFEHVRDGRTFSHKSHIVKHWINTHPDLPSPPEMEFTILARYRDCLSRQIGEALRIHYTKDIILNSKSEYQ